MLNENWLSRTSPYLEDIHYPSEVLDGDHGTSKYLEDVFLPPEVPDNDLDGWGHLH